MAAGEFVIVGNTVVEVVNQNGPGGSVEVKDIGDVDKLTPDKRAQFGKIASVLESLEAS